MERQRDVLDARISMMEKMRYITQRALTFPKDKPCLSYWDETWFAATDVPRERTQQAYAEAFSAHTDFCRNTIGVTGFPLGRIVDIPDLTRPDDFYYTKLLTWISPPESLAPWGDRVIRKPKGKMCIRDRDRGGALARWPRKREDGRTRAAALSRAAFAGIAGYRKRRSRNLCGSAWLGSRLRHNGRGVEEKEPHDIRARAFNHHQEPVPAASRAGTHCRNAFA